MRWAIAPLLFLPACASCESESLYDNPGVLEPRAAELDFGEVRIDRQEMSPLFLLNRGTGPVRLTRTAIDGPDAFTIARALDGVPGGGEFSLDLLFTPRMLGTHTATLSIDTDSEERPSFSVLLRGFGVAPPICEFDGTPCDDGSACTREDSCLGGACVGRAITCDDGVECTRDVCDPASGCTIIPDHTLCPDDDPCSLDQCTSDGCEHPGAPNGYPCGPVVACQTAHVCILEQCVEIDIPSDIPPDVVAETQLVHSPRSGVFQGDILFAAGTLAGVDRNTVLRIDARANLAAPIGAIDALDIQHATGARDRASATDWAALGANRYARVHTSSTGAWFFELFDTGDPRAVSIVARRPLTIPEGTLLFPAIGVSDQHVYFCAGVELASVDVRDPLNPGDATLIPGRGPCGPDRDQVVAHGPWWMNFTREDNAEGFQLFRVDPLEVARLIDHQYAIDGVHRYGKILSIALDETRAVIDLENEQYFWVIDLENAPTTFGLLTLDLPAPARLLGVFEKIGYFESFGEIRAVDFTNRDSPAELDYQFSSLPPAEDRRIFAASPEYLAITDALGRVAILTREDDPTSIEIRAVGTLDRLTRGESGYIGYSRRMMAHFSNGYLFAPAVETAPFTQQPQLEQPVFIDGPDAAIGIFSPRSFDELQGCIGASSCEVRRSFTSSSAIEVHTLHELPSIATFAEAWPGGPIDALGCTAVIAGLEQIQIADRCTLELRGTLPLSIRLGGGGRVVVHDDGIHATVMSDSTLVLIDLLAMAELATLTINRLVDVDYERGKWLVTTRSSANVYAIGANGAVLESTLPLPAESSARILGMRDQLVLIAGAELGRRVLIADVALIPAAVIHEVLLPTPPMDAVLEDGRAIIARIDGLSALAPICRPE